jgi:DNA-directed RNA polymerase subunit K/omega
MIGNYNVISEPELRITDSEMTPSEIVRILGIATRQIAKGRIPNVEMDGASMSSIDKAILELKNKRTPVYLLRPYPDRKTAEKWQISEMNIPEWFW